MVKKIKGIHGEYFGKSIEKWMQWSVKTAAICLVLYAVTGITACGKIDISPDASKNHVETDQDVIVLRYGDVNPEGNVIVKSAHFFADQVKELTNGHIEIDIYPSGQLGDDSQYYQGLQMGGLDLYRGNSATMDQFGELEISALALPYVFRSREHFWNVCNSELGREILQDIQNSGAEVVGLCYLDEGARNFFVTQKAVKQMSDLKNLKIRSMYSDVLESTISSFGAIPTPIVYAELYTALQSGEVDGAENPVSSYLTNKYYEVAPYYIRDEHIYAPSVLLISELTWNHLSEEDQEALRQAAILTEYYNRKAIEEAEEEAYRHLENAGVTIIEPSDLEKWRAAVKPVYDQYGSRYTDLVQKIQDIEN